MLYEMSVRVPASKASGHTIETSRDGIVVLDHTLVDEDTLGAWAGVDLDRVVG